MFVLGTDKISCFKCFHARQLENSLTIVGVEPATISMIIQCNWATKSSWFDKNRN